MVIPHEAGGDATPVASFATSTRKSSKPCAVSSSDCRAVNVCIRSGADGPSEGENSAEPAMVHGQSRWGPCRSKTEDDTVLVTMRELPTVQPVCTPRDGHRPCRHPASRGRTRPQDTEPGTVPTLTLDRRASTPPGYRAG